MSTKYALQPTPMRLFSASLEAHMAAYTEEIKLNQLNQEYQLAQNRIIREGELYNLSQADLMNRLNTLKEQLLNSIKPPVVKKVIEEKKFIKPSIKIPSPKSSSLQKEIEEKITSLKKTPSPEKKIKTESKFEQELKEKVKKLSPISTKSDNPISSTSATTSSNFEDSENVGKLNFQQVKKQMKEALTQSQYTQALQEMEKLPPNEKIAYMNKKISGGGLKKKKAKKNK